MKEITIYNTSTGIIEKTSRRSFDFTDVESMLEEGQSYVEGIFDIDTYEKIVDGE